MHAHHLRNKQQNTEVSHSEIHGSSSHGFTPGSRGYFFLIDTDGALSNRKHGLFHIRVFKIEERGRPGGVRHEIRPIRMRHL